MARDTSPIKLLTLSFWITTRWPAPIVSRSSATTCSSPSSPSSPPGRPPGRTAVLSRRWRQLWPRTDTLNLDRSYSDTGNLKLDPAWFWNGLNPFSLKAKLRADARYALSVTGRCPVRKLSLFVKGLDGKYCEDVMGTPRRGTTSSRDDHSYDLLAYLLGFSALRHLEEVHIKFELEDEEEHHMPCVFHLDPALLPAGDTLRVLDLPRCKLESPPGSATAFFPRLSALRLYKCLSSTRHLEELIRAMPKLESLHIEGHNFCYLGGGTDTGRLVVHSPSLTTLTLVDGFGASKGVEVDTPCLRAFKYDRPLTVFSMRSQTTRLAHVDLTLEWMYEEDCKRVGLRSAPLWKFLGNFQHAKIIRLKVQNIDCIAVDRDKDMKHDEHLVTLPGLQRLQLDVPYEPQHRDAAASAIASFLHSCPVIGDLRIRIDTDAWNYRNSLG